MFFYAKILLIMFYSLENQSLLNQTPSCTAAPPAGGIDNCRLMQALWNVDSWMSGVFLEAGCGRSDWKEKTSLILFCSSEAMKENSAC